MRPLHITYLFSLFLTFTCAVQAQVEHLGVLPVIEGNVVYQKVMEIDQKPLDEQIGSVMKWMSEQGFRPSASVRWSNDRVYCNGSGSMKVLWGPNDFRELYKEIHFKLELVVKKDRLQYTFRDFMVHEQSATYHLEIYKMENGRDVKHSVKMHWQIDAEIRNYLNSLFLQLNMDSEKLISRG